MPPVAEFHKAAAPPFLAARRCNLRNQFLRLDDNLASDARNDLILWLGETLEKTKALAEQDAPVESLACVEAQVIATDIQIQKAMTRARRNCRCHRGGVQCHKRVEHPENNKSRWQPDIQTRIPTLAGCLAAW